MKQGQSFSKQNSSYQMLKISKSTNTQSKEKENCKKKFITYQKQLSPNDRGRFEGFFGSKLNKQNQNNISNTKNTEEDKEEREKIYKIRETNEIESILKQKQNQRRKTMSEDLQLQYNLNNLINIEKRDIYKPKTTLETLFTEYENDQKENLQTIRKHLEKKNQNNIFNFSKYFYNRYEKNPPSFQKTKKHIKQISEFFMNSMNKQLDQIEKERSQRAQSTFTSHSIHI